MGAAQTRWTTFGALLLLLIALSCGGGSKSTNSSGTPSPGSDVPPGSGGNPVSSQQICNCAPSAPASTDYRHNQKHVPLPGATGQEITVSTILGWAIPPNPPADGPRTGLELQMFHIAHAWLHFVWLVGSDCDIHMEIADSTDPNAPRVVVETPIDSEYCPARQNLQQQLSAHGVPISEGGYELPHPLPVDVLGLAFQDYNHPRGTTHVATVWEIHPAIVNVTQ